uniref:Integrin beta n=1 Tax=Callorhinchus milii TaxID=7868 RepID=A0A4W3JLU5_CALMI
MVRPVGVRLSAALRSARTLRPEPDSSHMERRRRRQRVPLSPQPHHLPTKKILLTLLYLMSGAFTEGSPGVQNACAAGEATKCTECLLLGPECGWCFQEDFLEDPLQNTRCDLVTNLIRKGCNSNLIEFPVAKINIEESQLSQLAPSKVSLHLRPGTEASFILKVQRLDDYPLDLYHLVDTSASMVANLERLNSVGYSLSQKMATFSSNFQFGFGSFVDKPVSPFINIQPDKLVNPCSNYETFCLPAHGFINVLPLTENIREFTKAVEEHIISGNEDTPEGVLDAMLQVAVCENHIGWRKEAKRLLLMITDQISHLALDSKLGGIVLPNDGNCHLKNNIYTHSTIMDLIPLMPGVVAKQLNSELSNLSELVADAYQMLLSEVELQVDNHINGIYVNITAICPDGSEISGHNKCMNVKANDTVSFNITVGMTECYDGDKYIALKPIGYNETTFISVKSTCTCQCKGPIDHRAGRCFDEELELDCKHCQCKKGASNSSCKEMPWEQCLIERCQQHKEQPACSSRGICHCGKCLCYVTRLGRVYGKYCEKDDFSCPYHRGSLCAGNGECKGGECKCYPGWEGESCNCSSFLESCRSGSGVICSGRGTCVCGRCQCTESRASGTFCDVCPTCENSCENSWKCVECHLNHWPDSSNCSTSCSQMVLVDELSESEEERSQYCVFQAKNKYLYKFKMVATDTEKQYLYILENPEYQSNHKILTMCLVLSVGTVITGLIIVMIIRQIMMQWSSNRLKPPGSDCKVAPPQKNNTPLPTVSAKTITYRRDRPEEMHVYVNTIQVIEKLDL